MRCGKILYSGQATDDNMANAHSMLDTEDYKHTLRIGKTFCLSAATMVAQTLLNVTLNIKWLSRIRRILVPSFTWLQKRFVARETCPSLSST